MDEAATFCGAPAARSVGWAVISGIPLRGYARDSSVSLQIGGNPGNLHIDKRGSAARSLLSFRFP